jgi:thiol-disulfide isomerase/thioredoxin
MIRMARVVAIALVSLAPVFAQELPRQAPEEIIHFTGGKTAKVSDYEGKVVLVAFILTGCSHCQHTVGIMNGIQTDLGKRGLQIVGLAVNEDAPARLAQFYDKFKPTFPVGYCSAGDLPGFLQPPPGQRPLAPLLAFLDRKGMIRFEITGSDPNFFNDQEGDHIRAEVLKLLAEPGPSHARKARP